MIITNKNIYLSFMQKFKMFNFGEGILKMRDLVEININEGGRPVKRLAPTVKDIIDFEQQAGVKLPVEYVELLSHSNGGHPQLDSFVPSSSEGSRWCIDLFYHIGSDIRSTDNLTKVFNDWKKYLWNGVVPIARDPGGNQICLDTSKDGNVFICVHDEGFRIIEVAPSLSDFLDLLEVDPEMI